MKSKRIGTMTSSLLKILDDLQWQINPFLDDIRPLIFLENIWIITQILYLICRYSSVYSQKARGDETCPLGPIQSMCSAWHHLNDPSKDKCLGVPIHPDQTCLLTRSQWLIFTLKMVIIEMIQIILYKFYLLLINFSITSQLFWHPHCQVWGIINHTCNFAHSKKVWCWIFENSLLHSSTYLNYILCC